MPKFPALKVIQPIGEFFVASLPASLLLRVTAPDPLRAAVDAEYKGDEDEFRTAIKLLGTQRELEKARLRKISEYIDTVDSTFPNSIILAAKSRADSGKRGWRLETSDDGTAVVDISDDAAPAAVVDGQHRLYSFLHSQLDVRKKFQLVCAIFFDLPSPMQAMLFATINTNQKTVRRGMALNLYGYNIEDEPRDEWSPEKLAVFMTRRLNFDKDTALYRRIRIEAEGAPEPVLLPGAARVVPLASVVDGILGLITTDPKRDRNELRSERGGFLKRQRSRAQLRDDDSPFRTWYTRSADRELYDLVRGMTQTFHDIFWSQGTEKSMLTRAVGIRALFDVAIFLAKEKPEARQPSQKSVARFQKLLADSLRQSRHLDFTDPFFEATGRGQQRIRNAVLLASEELGLDTVPPEDLPEYRRLLKAT